MCSEKNKKKNFSLKLINILLMYIILCNDVFNALKVKNPRKRSTNPSRIKLFPPNVYLLERGKQFPWYWFSSREGECKV